MSEQVFNTLPRTGSRKGGITNTLWPDSIVNWLEGYSRHHFTLPILGADQVSQVCLTWHQRLLN